MRRFKPRENRRTTRGETRKRHTSSVWENMAACGLAILCFTSSPSALAEVGIASFYGLESCRHHPCRTANGERFTGRDMTAAHRTLPFGTRVKVCVIPRGKCVIVRINDRGPAPWTGRTIDLSRAAAGALGILRRGTARVHVELVK